MFEANREIKWKRRQFVESKRLNSISDYLFIHYELKGEDTPLNSQENKDSNEGATEYDSEDEFLTNAKEVNGTNNDVTENCYVDNENVERFERLSCLVILWTLLIKIKVINHIEQYLLNEAKSSSQPFKYV